MHKQQSVSDGKSKHQMTNSKSQISTKKQIQNTKRFGFVFVISKLGFICNLMLAFCNFKKGACGLHQRGVAALLTIVIVSAAALVIALSSSILGLGELDIGYVDSKGEESLSIADGCVEEALRRIRLDTDYSGSSITQSNGTCIISVVPSGSNRTITVTASTTDSYYKKIEAGITLSGNVITLDSWEEKDD